MTSSIRIKDKLTKCVKFSNSKTSVDTGDISSSLRTMRVREIMDAFSIPIHEKCLELVTVTRWIAGLNRTIPGTWFISAKREKTCALQDNRALQISISLPLSPLPSSLPPFFVPSLPFSLPLTPVSQFFHLPPSLRPPRIIPLSHSPLFRFRLSPVCAFFERGIPACAAKHQEKFDSFKERGVLKNMSSINMSMNNIFAAKETSASKLEEGQAKNEVSGTVGVFANYIVFMGESSPEADILIPIKVDKAIHSILYSQSSILTLNPQP